MAASDKKLSKTLSYILRHGASSMGLQLHDGFVYIDELLKLPQLRRYNLQDIAHVVQSNDKQRFHMEVDPATGKHRIRANQGHTMEVAGLDLTPITDWSQYPTVVHGTYRKCWGDIRQMGLSRMGRNHIHFAPGDPGEEGVISGMRASCDILIYIDMKKALDDGFTFFLSANHVVLCPGDRKGLLPPRYFREVVNRRTREKYSLEKVA